MSASFDQENCPRCLADDGICQLLEVDISKMQEAYATGTLYSCPRCGEVFSHKELQQIYGLAPIDR